MKYTFKPPETEQDWHDYYQLRWQILRQPWQQPRGSEKDEFETNAFHLMASDHNDAIVGVGRIHKNSDIQSQVRYMAVLPEHQGKRIGKHILTRLEQKARDWGCHEIILNARSTCVAFYQKQNYQIIGEDDTMFGSIEHKRMRKSLR